MLIVYGWTVYLPLLSVHLLYKFPDVGDLDSKPEHNRWKWIKQNKISVKCREHRQKVKKETEQWFTGMTLCILSFSLLWHIVCMLACCDLVNSPTIEQTTLPSLLLSFPFSPLLRLHGVISDTCCLALGFDCSAAGSWLVDSQLRLAILRIKCGGREGHCKDIPQSRSANKVSRSQARNLVRNLACNL